MATKSIRAVRLPSGGSLLITLIAQAVPLAEGVGIMNDRGRMIGWIAIPGPHDENRGAKFEMVLDIFNELINAPRNATQPNWDFLGTEAP
ncbi:hypothetical protein [Duganella fentianensis]|uniref:hypothetical protein n=1 Tax=Duganella fentianensis TaxID=2692177 RepID=UPI0032B17832